MPRNSLSASSEIAHYVLLQGNGVLLRGNGRQACSSSDDDYFFFLECLRHASQGRVWCHAYALIEDQAHFILTQNDVQGIAAAMQLLRDRYERYILQRYGVVGGGWLPDYRTCAIREPEYLLACFRHIEMVPVFAGVAQHAADYEWSSYRAHAYGEPNYVLQEHAEFRALHRDQEERRFLYRALFESDVQNPITDKIEQDLQSSAPTKGSRRAARSGAQVGALEVA